jgi:hypothetical protein
VVTLLTPLPVEPELELELSDEDEDDDVSVLCELDVDGLESLVVAVVVVVAGVDATVVADDLLASAGSCPETSTIAIISQAATNSATAPETTRRRIIRARAARSLRSA